jgi:hypothetical protein
MCPRTSPKANIELANSLMLNHSATHFTLTYLSHALSQIDLKTSTVVDSVVFVAPALSNGDVWPVSYTSNDAFVVRVSTTASDRRVYTG